MCNIGRTLLSNSANDSTSSVRQTKLIKELKKKQKENK